MFGPPREEQTESVGAVMLAFGPGDLFDGDRVTAFAIDAAHAVEEPHGDVPEGHEIE